MALQTLYVNAGTDSVEWKCRIIVVENSTNVSNNTSSLTLTLQFTRSRSGGYEAWCGADTTATISVGGVNQNVAVKGFHYYSVGVDDWKTLGSATFNNVYHNNDGTLDCPVSAYWHQTSCKPYTCNPSGKVKLTTIPRASSIKIGTTATKSVGDTVPINITKASSSFTHTVYYKAGTMSSSVTIVDKTSNSTVNWTVPASMYTYMANTASTTCNIYCDTYNGSTMLGTKSCSFTLYTNNTAPSISSVAAVDTDSNITAITGDSSKIVKGVSDVKVTVTAAASQGASIKNYKYEYGSTVKTSTSNILTITDLEVASIKVTVTDSRGKTVSSTKTLSVIDYIKPTITDFTVDRESSLSDNVTLSANIKWFNEKIGTKTNTLTIKYRYKSSGSYGSYTTITGTSSGNTCSVNCNLSGISNLNNYTFELVVTDLLGNASGDTSTTTCGKGEPIIDIGKNDVVINGELKSTTMKADTYSSNKSYLVKFDVDVNLDQNNLTNANTVYATKFKKEGQEVVDAIHGTNYTYIKYYDGSAVYYAHHKCKDCTNGAPSDDKGSAVEGITGLQTVTCDYTYPTGITWNTVTSASVTTEGAGVGYWSAIGDMFDLINNGTKTKYNARVYFTSNLGWTNNIADHGLSFVISGTWK